MRKRRDNIDFEIVLKALGADYKEHETYFSMRSLVRSNKKKNMILWKNSGHVEDYGGSFAGSIESLVKTVTGKSFSKFMGDDAVIKSPVKPQKLKRRVRKDFKIEGILRPISSNPEVQAYCESRMTDSFIKDFCVENYFRQAIIHEKPYSERVIIPILKDRKTVSLELRDYTRKQEKKALFPIGSDVSFLFNIDRLNFDEPLVVVEGILDTPKIYTYITKNVTCTFGIKITPKQKGMLRKFKEVILFPDDDDGGDRFISNMSKTLDYDFKIAKVLGKDPGASSLEETKKALTNVKYLSEYEIDRYDFFNKKVNLI